MMAWWQYFLIVAGVTVVGALFAFTLPFAIRLIQLALWKAIPDCGIKRQLFKVRATEPEHIGNDPWVTQYHIKGPAKSNRLSAPPEFISADEFKARTRDDRR